MLTLASLFAAVSLAGAADPVALEGPPDAGDGAPSPPPSSAGDEQGYLQHPDEPAGGAGSAGDDGDEGEEDAAADESGMDDSGIEVEVVEGEQVPAEPKDDGVVWPDVGTPADDAGKGKGDGNEVGGTSDHGAAKDGAPSPPPAGELPKASDDGIVFGTDEPIFKDNPLTVGEDPISDVFEGIPDSPQQGSAPPAAPTVAPGPEEFEAVPDPTLALPPEPEPSGTAGPRPSGFARVRATGLAVLLGPGVSTYADSDMRDITGTAITYTLSVQLGLDRYIGGEVSYLGSTQSIDAFGLNSSALLIANGVEAAVRFQFALGSWQPYFLSGVGWERFNVVKSGVSGSFVKGGDSIAEIPLLLGLTWRVSHLTLDLRTGYRIALGEDLIGHTTGPGLDTWELILRGGWQI